MNNIVYKYDSDYERVTIRVDDIVIGVLKEIKVDNVAFVIQALQEIYQQMFNKKVNCDER